MALAPGDLHGYGIKKAVEDHTEGRLRLGPGTLYEGIHRMEADGWIEEVEGPETRGKPRRYYRLTEEGRRRMEDELQRLDRVVAVAREQALIPGSGG